MITTFITEIPENSTRRIHLNYEKTEFIDCGAILEKISTNNGKMPTVYGFLDGYINTTEDNSEHKEFVDALFVETDLSFTTGDKVQVKVIGMFEREDGDHKVLVTQVNSLIDQFNDVDKNLQTLLLDFHGHNKKIIKIYSPEEASHFLDSCDKFL